MNVNDESELSRETFWRDHKLLQHYNCSIAVPEINNHEATYYCGLYCEMSLSRSPVSLCYSDYGVHLYCNKLCKGSCIPLDISDSRVLTGAPRVCIDIVEEATSITISTAHIKKPVWQEYGLFFMTLVEYVHIKKTGDVRPNAQVIQYTDTNTGKQSYCLYLMRDLTEKWIVVGQRYCLDDICFPRPTGGRDPYGAFRYFVCHSLVGDIEDEARQILVEELAERVRTCRNDDVERFLEDCYPPCDEDDYGFSSRYVEGSKRYLMWVNEGGGNPDDAPKTHIPPKGCTKKTLPYWRRTDEGGIMYYPAGVPGRLSDFNAGETARLRHQYLDTGSKPIVVWEPWSFHRLQLEMPLPPEYPEGKYRTSPPCMP